ncbi:MAG: hypothetical protein ACTH2Y_12820 [Corynebacterium sp.]|uniref:hypothetical protein n=1 Tax=unclassified Corynebacterium TaxID=2624378 RepID=UPI00264749FE|nr:hypothetical protein [Corynebacterium sp.]MDN5582536.1 hypothetical protein [Corynebacterium sp.]MDN6258921.1 hypothetical protein [Corynebacterium sp.]MDN6324934.1 hypothetical protein [Corynebacterium sp.]MDN6386204.1 hypothetical protein [Corynebacterium sp.]MDN6509542.1 hypothetical protein [Corynebacterium sp.]
MLILPEVEQEVITELERRLGRDVGVVFTDGDEEDTASLVEQWTIEHPGQPVGQRRIRTIGSGADSPVDATGFADSEAQQVAEAVVDIICPHAREEERQLQAGELFEVTPDAIPWSGHTLLWEGREV